MPATTAATRWPAPTRCRNFLDLTEHAFAACVHNFTTNTLTPGERKCIEATSKKFIAHSLRVSTVFAEIESQAAEERATKAKAEVR